MEESSRLLPLGAVPLSEVGDRRGRGFPKRMGCRPDVVRIAGEAVVALAGPAFGGEELRQAGFEGFSRCDHGGPTTFAAAALPGRCTPCADGMGAVLVNCDRGGCRGGVRSDRTCRLFQPGTGRLVDGGSNGFAHAAMIVVEPLALGWGQQPGLDAREVDRRQSQRLEF